MFFVQVFLIWLTFEKCLGACPTMKDPCLLNGFQYTGMCDCASKPPQHCTRPEEKCEACAFQGSVCSNNPGAPKCCPLLSGQAYCNEQTKKCESIPYCTGDGSNCAFNDLSPTEISTTVNIIQSSNMFLQGQIQFPVIRTLEPSKSDWIAGKALNQRIAYVAVLDLLTNTLFEVQVDLVRKTVIKKDLLLNQLPTQTSQSLNIALKVAKSDPRVKQAYERRGLKPKNAWFAFLPLGAGGSPTGYPPGQRLFRGVAQYVDTKTRWSWRPVAGLQVTVDLHKMIVVEFLDDETRPLPPSPQILNTPISPPLKPLIIQQPEGSSIEVRGQLVSWYKWKFMYSMDPIHGLQLFHVRYQADCEERLVLYKLSLSEMFVPYGAEGVQWRWRRPLDAGEYGLGLSLQPQEIGQDVPENTILLNCTQYDAADSVPTPANPRVLEGCIAAYERDVGMFYKHVDLGSGRIDGRRGRQMVMSFYSVIGNYGYVYEYIFHMDGVLQVNVRLTGAMVTRGTSATKNDANCLESCDAIVDDYLTAPIHQHFFNYRMDFDVDGPQNYVLQSDVDNLPVGLQNLDGGAFAAKKKIIKTEAAHDSNPKSSRSWYVTNANSRNRFNSPRSYAVKPIDIAYHFANAGNPYVRQTEFVKHAFWTTVYKDEEQSAAGTFPASAIPYQGLPQYIKNQESLENTDVVTWYTAGLTHTPRPEEWPIMNVHQAGFSLVPYNFMSQNSEVPQKGHCS